MQFICFSKGNRLVPCWFPVACGLICLEIFGYFTGLVKRGSMALFYGRGHRFSFQTFLSTTLNWSYALVSPNISPYVLVCSAGQAHCLLTGVPHVLHTPHTQFKILVRGFDKPKGLYVLWSTECGLAIQMYGLRWSNLSGLEGLTVLWV